MCICCCLTRKSLLIYIIVISSLAFIYGIIAISTFGSNARNYKRLKEVIKIYESQNDITNSRRLQNSYYDYDYYPYSYTPTYVDNDEKGLNNINKLTDAKLVTSKYNFIKRLKGIENGLGSILFIFPIIFLTFTIAYLVFTCNIHENQVMKTKYFFILNNHLYFFNSFHLFSLSLWGITFYCISSIFELSKCF